MWDGQKKVWRTNPLRMLLFSISNNVHVILVIADGFLCIYFHRRRTQCMKSYQICPTDKTP